MRENEILADLRTQIQKIGCTTFRNNVGRLRTEDGRWVNFGLCVGSADTIGWTEYIIQPKDVGRRMAIFTAFETKVPNRGRRTDEQIAFIGRVQIAGGIAAFCTSKQDALEAIQRFKDFVR